MNLLIIYAIAYIITFSIIRGSRFSTTIFRLPKGTGFIPTLINLLSSSLNLSSFGMVSAMVLLQGEVGFWFVLSIAFIAGFMIYVFGPLWAQLDFKNENEFILFRFPTKWGVVLHRFRGIYVGLIVNAIVIGGMMLAFSDIISSFTSITRDTALYFSFGFVLMNIGRNSLASKVLSDTFNFALMMVVLVIAYIISAGMEADLSMISREAVSTIGNFPYTDTPYFLHFILYVGIQWWSAQMFDSSGVNAQRLMGFSRQKIHLLLIVYYLCLVLFDVAVAVISLKAAGLVTPEHVPEQAIFLFFKHHLPTMISIIVPIAVFGVFAASVESQLNWAGSLVDSVLPARWQANKLTPYGVMIVVATTAILCALYFNRIYALVNFILGISAGVSLIFVLRWFVPRINAQVQLSAMLGAIIYTFAVKTILATWFPNLGEINQQLYLMLSVTFLVLLTAVVVSALTITVEDLEAYKNFRSSLTFPTSVTSVVTRMILLIMFLCLVGLFLFRMLL